MFIWKMPALLNGEIHAIAQRAVNGKFQVVFIKFCEADAIYIPPGFPGWGKNLTREHVEILKSYDLKVWGWQFNRGIDPVGEGITAAHEAIALGLDGVAFDVETQFESQTLNARVRRWATSAVRTIQDRKRIPGQFVVQSEFEAQANPAQKAHQLMQNFKSVAPGMPTAFISFAFYKSPYSGGTWHNKSMYVVFMEECDFGMPMTYWWGSSVENALWMLKHSVDQWEDITDKPIIPIGRLYIGDGGSATAEAITAFGEDVRDRELIGEGWWRFGSAITNPSWWNAVAALSPWQLTPLPTYPPFQDLPEDKRLDILAKDLKQRGIYPPPVI